MKLRQNHACANPGKALPFAGVMLATALTLTACSKNEVPTPTRRAPSPDSSATSAAVASASTYRVLEAGSAKFLIDAPLEKIKGESNHFRGSLAIDPSDLTATHGQVDVDLNQLRTATFDDANKNASQTGHAHNWLELGSDVDPKQRAENQWARFTLLRVESLSVKDLTTSKPLDGRVQVELKAEGNLWLHGVNAKKSTRLSVSFEGPATAPTRVIVKTIEPLRISLREHDIKPRDVAGKFLQGALEKVGQKIDDQVQVSLEFSAAASSATASPAVSGPRMLPYATTPENRVGTLAAGLGIPVGQRAPDAELQDEGGHAVRLSDILKHGPTLLVFYRGGWCPYCSFEIHELTSHFADYQRRGVTPVAVSVDRAEEASKSRATFKIPFPVLSDPDLHAHQAFHVVHKADDAEFGKLKEYGVDLERASGRAHHSYAVPSLFLIDRTGHVRWAHADPDYKVRPGTTQILAAIDAARL